MTFNEYQKFTDTTAIYPNPDSDFIYPALGLNGETGEFTNKLIMMLMLQSKSSKLAEFAKKIIRDSKQLTPNQLMIAHELGDILWYVARCARAIDMTLDKIVELNIVKLQNRQIRNKLSGDGDNR